MQLRTTRRKFPLWLLLVATGVFFGCFGIGWVVRETQGKLVLEHEADFIVFGFRSVGFLSIPSDAHVEGLNSRIKQALELHFEETESRPPRFMGLHIHLEPDRHFVQYNVERWVVRRLDLRKLDYVDDYDDSVAKARTQRTVDIIEEVHRKYLAELKGLTNDQTKSHDGS